MPVESLVLTFGAVALAVATIALLLATFFTVEPSSRTRRETSRG